MERIPQGGDSRLPEQQHADGVSRREFIKKVAVVGTTLASGEGIALEYKEMESLKEKVLMYRISAIPLLGKYTDTLFIMPGDERDHLKDSLYVYFKQSVQPGIKAEQWMRGRIDTGNAKNLEEQLAMLSYPIVKQAIERAIKEGKGYFPFLEDKAREWMFVSPKKTETGTRK